MLARRALLGAGIAGLFVPSLALAQAPKDPLASRFGGPFSLTDHTGTSVTDKTYAGMFMLIYFGFTRCTDACPIDVPNLTNALDLIKPLDERIQPLFITVDPTDTADDLKEYVTAFHPRLVGLTGPESALAAVAKAYRVHRLRVKHDVMRDSIRSSGPRHAVTTSERITPVHGDKPHVQGQKYSINHGTLSYLMGRDGGFLSIVPHASKAERIAEVLKKYVSV